MISNFIQVLISIITIYISYIYIFIKNISFNNLESIENDNYLENDNNLESIENDNYLENDNNLEYDMELHLDDIEEISINMNDWILNQHMYSNVIIYQEIYNASNLKIKLQNFIERLDNNNEYGKKLLEDFIEAIHIFENSPTNENMINLNNLVPAIIDFID